MIKIFLNILIAKNSNLPSSLNTQRKKGKICRQVLKLITFRHKSNRKKNPVVVKQLRKCVVVLGNAFQK